MMSDPDHETRAKSGEEGREDEYHSRPNESHHRPNETHHRPNESHHRPNEPYHGPNESYHRQNEPYHQPNEHHHEPNEPYHRPNEPYHRPSEVQPVEDEAPRDVHTGEGIERRPPDAADAEQRPPLNESEAPQKADVQKSKEGFDGSDIDRLHQHVTELQNSMKQDTGKGGPPPPQEGRSSSENTAVQENTDTETSAANKGIASAEPVVGDDSDEEGDTSTESVEGSSEQRGATGIVNKILEKLKDQDEEEDEQQGEETEGGKSMTEVLIQRWEEKLREEKEMENGNSEEEQDLEKSLNESVSQVLPAQEKPKTKRERTFKDDVVDYLNDKDEEAELSLEKEHSKNVFSFLKKSLINLAHKYHSCVKDVEEETQVLWSLYPGPRDDLCVPQYPCSNPKYKTVKVKSEFASSDENEEIELEPFIHCGTKKPAGPRRGRPRTRPLRSRPSRAKILDSDNENGKDDVALVAGAPIPIGGDVSDDNNAYWPEFDREEDLKDFIDDDEDSDVPKKKRKRGRKPKHPIKIKLPKQVAPLGGEEGETTLIKPKIEPDSDLDDAGEDDGLHNDFYPGIKKKRGRPSSSRLRLKESPPPVDDDENAVDGETDGEPLSDVTLNRETSQCFYCQKVFLTKWKMNKHMNTEHRNDAGGFSCPIPECTSTFQKVTFLIRHHRSHMGKNLTCPICPHKSFHRLDHLKKHLRTHTNSENDTSCMCSICGKVLSRPDHLKKHEQRHLTETIFSCKYCGRQFTHEWKLERHEASHSAVRAHKCEICHRTFTSQIALKYHVKRHTGEKPHKCSKCPKAFYDEAHLKRHELTHSNKNSFMCSVCGMGFRYEHGLRRHERRHELQDENGRYTCKLCDKTFADSWKARRHEMTHNAQRVRAYKCSTCAKGFYNRGALEVHERIHTDLRPYSCEVCGKSFRQSQELTAHNRIHTGERPFICATCGQSFTTASNLRRHEKGKHAKEKNHYCVICNKGFHRGTDLRRHHATHTGQKPHPCPQCTMHFTTSYSVRRHLEKAHGKVTEGPKRRRPQQPPPQGNPLSEHQQQLIQQQQQQMEQNIHQQQQHSADLQQQPTGGHSKSQHHREGDEYRSRGQGQSQGHPEVSGGQLLQSQPPPLLAVVPHPSSHEPPPAHAHAHSQHVHGSHKHYSSHSNAGGAPHVPGGSGSSSMHGSSSSSVSHAAAAAQIASHHISSLPQFHGSGPPDRPVFPERAHMDRPMFPPSAAHNDRDPGSNSGRTGYHPSQHPHGHDRDPRPVFPGVSSDQLMERAMRGDGQFFYPLNLIQQAPMHFNMDQLLHMASQQDGNPMSMSSHPPNSISQ